MLEETFEFICDLPRRFRFDFLRILLVNFCQPDNTLILRNGKLAANARVGSTQKFRNLFFMAGFQESLLLILVIYISRASRPKLRLASLVIDCCAIAEPPEY